MDAACITTPFGRRAMSLGLLARYKQAETTVPDIKRNKWKLFRAICEARAELEVSDRSLTVLDALLSFYPSDELSASSALVVFPSNAQLSIRARGMTAPTLRRHLAALVNAGLILRKDSPNGKRYARRGRGGNISDAFGFSLAPLLARAQEIEGIAGQILADRELVRVTRERITLCRREITKLIQAAQDSHIDGDWSNLHERFRSFISSISRRPDLEDLQRVLAQLAELRSRIVKLLEDQDNSAKMCANESQNERHTQDSQTQSISESEAGLDYEKIAPPLPTNHPDTGLQDNPDRKSPSITLDIVLRACMEIQHYGPGGHIRTWRDLLTATAALQSMLQISPSAFRDACQIMGPENASVAMACIFERGDKVNSAGAYLRSLTTRAAQRQFTVGPMVAALLQAKAMVENQP
ncbi:plasmid replication protein RepC [Rhizobium sp. NPDC090275]|uniref:plasmid replication protein RepC n=1 Tax=Rhizobium sp. NPDC090275 TaxID=3364498 RepID=UPI003839FB0A